MMHHYRVRYMMIDGRRVEIGREHVSTKTLGQTKFRPAAESSAYRDVKLHLQKLGVSSELVDLSIEAGPETLRFLSPD